MNIINLAVTIAKIVSVFVSLIGFVFLINFCASTLFISSFKEFHPDPITGYYSKDFALYKNDLRVSKKINLKSYLSQFCVLQLQGYSSELGPIKLYKQFVKDLDIGEKILNERSLIDFVVKNGLQKDIFLLDTFEGKKILAKLTGDFLIVDILFQKRYSDSRLRTDMKIVDARSGIVVFEVDREAPSLGAVGSICDIELAPIFNAAIDWRKSCL